LFDPALLSALPPFPRFLPIYESYDIPVKRADALRVFILHT
jgi:mannosyltransferase OCH1-like enzyme